MAFLLYLGSDGDRLDLSAPGILLISGTGAISDLMLSDAVHPDYFVAYPDIIT
jgi:hypothetical protein